MAEKEKRRATTFVTSRGAVINVAAPLVYIAPGVTPVDVTNPTEMREVLREYWAQRLLPGTGRVIFQDGFEDEIVSSFRPGGPLPGSSISRDADLAFMGEASLRISTQATVGSQCYAEFPVPSTPSKEFGLDLHFVFPISNGYNTVFQIGYIGQDRVRKYASVRYVLSAYYPGDYITDGKWQFQASDWTWKDISDFKLFWYTFKQLQFSRLKLVGDFSAEKYVSLTVNDTVFDLSAHSVHKTVTPLGHPGLFIYIYNYNNPTAGGIADLYIDNLMVTDEG